MGKFAEGPFGFGGVDATERKAGVHKHKFAGLSIWYTGHLALFLNPAELNSGPAEERVSEGPLQNFAGDSQTHGWRPE
jgi:hypothetical protein